MGKRRVATIPTETCPDNLLVPGGRGELWTSSGVYTEKYSSCRMEKQGQLPGEPPPPAPPQSTPTHQTPVGPLYWARDPPPNPSSPALH